MPKKGKKRKVVSTPSTTQPAPVATADHSPQITPSIGPIKSEEAKQQQTAKQPQNVATTVTPTKTKSSTPASQGREVSATPSMAYTPIAKPPPSRASPAPVGPPPSPTLSHEHAKLMKKRGDEELKRGNFTAAVGHYTKAIALCGKNPVFLVTLFTDRAFTHARMKEYNKAVDDCNVAIQLNPNYLPAYLCRGYCRFHLQRFSSALDDYERACKLLPPTPIPIPIPTSTPTSTLANQKSSPRPSQAQSQEKSKEMLQQTQILSGKSGQRSKAQNVKQQQPQLATQPQQEHDHSQLRPVLQQLKERVQKAREMFARSNKVNKAALEWMGDCKILDESNEPVSSFISSTSKGKDQAVGAVEISAETLPKAAAGPLPTKGKAKQSQEISTPNEKENLQERENAKSTVVDEVGKKKPNPANANPIASATSKVSAGGGLGGDLPPLVPVGEALDSYMPDLENLTGYEAEQQAFREKELGNEAFVSTQYLVALVHYSRAIKLHSRESVFFSNRALVYLKLNRFYEAITDCTASIDRKPSIKAYARRAAAWVALKEYSLAAEDYRKALYFEPRNQDCLDKLGRCLICMEEDFLKKLQANPTNEKMKRDLQSVRDEIRRIGAILNSH
jgi:tetratricopeptide (TPR) repeat protein